MPASSAMMETLSQVMDAPTVSLMTILLAQELTAAILTQILALTGAETQHLILMGRTLKSATTATFKTTMDAVTYAS